MKIHLSKLDVLELICDKYNIKYNTVVDTYNKVIDIDFVFSPVEITWDAFNSIQMDKQEDIKGIDKQYKKIRYKSRSKIDAN